MKIALALFITILVLAGVGTGYYFYKSRQVANLAPGTALEATPMVAPTPSTPATPATPTSTTPALLVTPLSFQVFVAAAEIKAPTPATIGTHVKTNQQGRALIEGTHNTVLDSNSEIVLAQYDSEKNQTLLQLQAGNLWARVKKLSDQGETFEVETQNARISVRGTSFGVFKTPTSTTVVVTDGLVNVHTPLGKDVLVNASNKAVISNGLPALVSPLNAADVGSAWFKLNNPTYKFPVLGSAGVGSPTPTTPTAPSVGMPKPTMTTSSLPLSQPVTMPTVTSTITQTVPTTPTSPSTQTTSTGTTQPSSTTTAPAVPSTTTTSTTTTSPSTTTTTSTPTIQLRSISPSSVVAGSTTRMTLSGTNFVKARLSSILVANVRTQNLTVVNDGTATFTFSALNVRPGIYSVVAEDAAGNLITLRSAVTVTAVR